MNPQKTNLRYAFITFNPHAGHGNALNDFLTLLLPKLSKCENYAHCNEDVGRPNQHFHCLVSGSFKDLSKIVQWIMSKDMKLFAKTFKDSPSVWDIALDLKLVPNNEDDVMKLLGYVLKSEIREEVQSQKIKGFSKQLCFDAVNYYFTTQKHKMRMSCQKDPWILLTKKNAHNIITQYCDKNKMTLRDVNLVRTMKCDRHSFIDLTSKAQNELFGELLLAEGNCTKFETEIIDDEITAKNRDGLYRSTHYLDAPEISDCYNVIDVKDKEIARLKELVKLLDTARVYPWVYSQETS